MDSETNRGRKLGEHQTVLPVGFCFGKRSVSVTAVGGSDWTASRLSELPGAVASRQQQQQTGASGAALCPAS